MVKLTHRMNQFSVITNGVLNALHLNGGYYENLLYVRFASFVQQKINSI